MNMSSSHPYLIRAIHSWISDNGLTPYILVRADHPEVHVPREYARGGKIILNISERAVQGLQLENDVIRFSARFGGKQWDVDVPIHAVIAIYAKENGKGMVLNHESEEDESAPASRGVDGDEVPKKAGRPHLELVK